MFDANEPPALPPDSSTAAQTPAKTPAKTSRTVTRYDIATAIMKRVPAMSRREATQVFECALQEIAEALSKREENVKLHEFGTFFVRERASRPAHNPLSSDVAPRRSRRFLNFKPSLGLKEKVERAHGHASIRRKDPPEQ
jgi:nucleoid DNA-binding protein